MIIQGPHASARSISSDILSHLQPLARAAGRTLELCRCAGLREFVARIKAVRPHHTEFMLLDPGDLAQQVNEHPDAGLGEALDNLATPYIEVHDDTDDTLQPRDGWHNAPAATIIIHGDLAASYRIGLGIALRQLQDKLDRTG
jgi:3-dehydroquinate dehydratase II